MDVTIKHNPAFALAVVQLSGNETIKVEPGAMVSHSDGVEMATSAEGGLFGGLKRMVAGESFFQNTYTAPPGGGEITLAASLPGDVRVLMIEGQDLLLKSGAYMSSESGVTIDASWGGAKGFFGTSGLVLLRVSGRGKVLIGAYGALEERVLTPGQRYTVDTGHIVTLDPTISFKLRKSGGWKSTILGGEGLVCELTGPGRVLMQSRSEESFLGWLLPKLPTRSN